MAEDNNSETPYTCEYCGNKYKSRQALSRHKKTCEYKPSEHGIKDNSDDSDGISLFGNDDSDNDNVNDDVYQCGGCGHKSKSKFTFCPKCGVKNGW